MAVRFDAYHKWFGIPPDEQPPHHYRLLGIQPFESDPEVIGYAADQRMGLLKTFATSQNGSLAEDLLDQVARARVCLLNPAKKHAYDSQLREQLGAASPPSQPPEGIWLPPLRGVGTALEVSCPHCDEESVYDLAPLSQLVPCKLCRQTMRLPGRDEVERAVELLAAKPIVTRSDSKTGTASTTASKATVTTRRYEFPEIAPGDKRKSRVSRRRPWVTFVLIALGGLAGLAMGLLVLSAVKPGNPLVMWLRNERQQQAPKPMGHEPIVRGESDRTSVNPPKNLEHLNDAQSADTSSIDRIPQQMPEVGENFPLEFPDEPLKPDQTAEPTVEIPDAVTDPIDSIPNKRVVDEVLGPVIEAPAGPATLDIRLALSGREPNRKAALLKRLPGTNKTEKAVALGLRWLASKQHRRGLWSLQGPYPNGGQQENVQAASAMALLAFLGTGHTPKDGLHRRVVVNGARALSEAMDKDGRFFEGLPSSHQMYTQALCTTAFCELYAMTGDKKYGDKARKAVEFCLVSQSPGGGWRYQPGEAGDTSVTGWFVMALQTARMADIEVPPEAFQRIGRFLDSVARDDGSRFAYRPTDGATLTLTAGGLLCRQYLGWPRDDPRLNNGALYLLGNLPEWQKRNVYYWHYATQVLHHLDGDPWRIWNERMREILTESQETRRPEAGSWDPTEDRWGAAAGRLYVTCLSLYILEAYYRHLPLYEAALPDDVAAAHE
jgi:hypothetical protein